MSAYETPSFPGLQLAATLRKGLRAWIGTSLALIVSLMAPITSAGAWNLGAEARLLNTAMQPVGMARLIQLGGSNVLVQVHVRHLPPGFHGFHVHAVGECLPGAMNFVSAGGHFDTGRSPSLPPRSHKDHSGDFPVLLVNADGTANAVFSTDRFDLADLFDADGSALIIHAAPDNYANIPGRYLATPPARAEKMPDDMTLRTGDSGDRIACGVVKKLIYR